MKINIEILNSIECKACELGRKFLKPHMYITKEFWRRGLYGRMIKKTYPYFLVDKEGYFLTGFIPRVKKICDDSNIEITWSGQVPILNERAPSLTGIEFRPDQVSLISSAIEKKRGVLKAPTGSGKTILALGIVSSFPDIKILYLAHTISICGQVAKEFEKYGYNVGRIYGGKTETYSQITVATRQSLIKLPISEYNWKLVILDEVHHLSSFKGQYADIFMKVNAPIKIGMTATLPTSEEAKMSVEGFIGPVIGNLSIQEAGELEILAKPKIQLVKVPGRTTDLRKYADIYQSEIVENRNRNRLILEIVKEKIDIGHTVLILVTKILHGKLLQEMAEEIFEIDVEYLCGASEAEERELVKEALIKKQKKCVIATAIWREGVDLPSLNCVINACGGKSEIMTLQILGRGLRKTDDKSEVVIVDFLDTARYLAEHTITRLGIYVENGWL